MKFRIINDSYHDAATNMALDEAILRKRKDVDYNTIRVYQWKPSAVSIGYFQSIYDEINLNFAEKHRIFVVRRITGGGAVYHDENGEITYSIVVGSDYSLPERVQQSYAVLAKGILQGLIDLGLNARFEGINDIVVGSKKISGNAQTRRFDSILQHGTVLLNVNPEVMFSVLNVPEEKIRDKLIHSVYERVTSLKNEGVTKTAEELKLCFLEGYKKIMDAEFFEDFITKEEIQLAEQIKKERYQNSSWNFKR